MATAQLRLFPKTVCAVFKCQWCRMFAVHFLVSLKPITIRCNECGETWEEGKDDL